MQQRICGNCASKGGCVTPLTCRTHASIQRSVSVSFKMVTQRAKVVCCQSCAIILVYSPFNKRRKVAPRPILFLQWAMATIDTIDRCPFPNKIAVCHFFTKHKAHHAEVRSQQSNQAKQSVNPSCSASNVPSHCLSKLRSTPWRLSLTGLNNLQCQAVTCFCSIVTLTTFSGSGGHKLVIVTIEQLLRNEHISVKMKRFVTFEAFSG